MSSNWSVGSAARSAIPPLRKLLSHRTAPAALLRTSTCQVEQSGLEGETIAERQAIVWRNRHRRPRYRPSTRCRMASCVPMVRMFWPNVPNREQSSAGPPLRSPAVSPTAHAGSPVLTGTLGRFLPLTSGDDDLLDPGAAAFVLCCARTALPRATPTQAVKRSLLAAHHRRSPSWSPQVPS